MKVMTGDISSHEHAMGVMVAPHPHPLKLESSLHYEFCCHLCNKPGSNAEQLYRCKLCEFNSHIHCAALRQRKSIADEEITQLDHPKHPAKKSATDSPQSDLSQQEDKSATISIDFAPTPSIQFSDACFSIDLQKSYMGYNRNHEGDVQLRDIINRGGLLGTPKTKEKSRSHTVEQDKKLQPDNQEFERSLGKTKEVTIHDELFANWGINSQAQKSLIATDSNTSKGSIGRARNLNQAGSASKTEKGTVWKQLMCCYHPDPGSKVF